MKTKIELTCPNCKAHLSVGGNREILFCEYCGTKILLNDENTYTIRHINEAELMLAETERLLRLKEIEMEEREAEVRKGKNKMQTKLAKYLACFGAPLMAIGLMAILLSKEPLFAMLALLGFLLLDIAFILVVDTFNSSKKK